MSITKYIQFTAVEDERKRKIFSFKKLQSEFWPFFKISLKLIYWFSKYLKWWRINPIVTAPFRPLILVTFFVLSAPEIKYQLTRHPNQTGTHKWTSFIFNTLLSFPAGSAHVHRLIWPVPGSVGHWRDIFCVWCIMLRWAGYHHPQVWSLLCLHPGGLWRFLGFYPVYIFFFYCSCL